MKIPKSLLVSDINAYSEQGALRKQKFHTAAKKFLKELAMKLGITDQCDIRSEMGGIAGSGEVTLHGDHIYIQLSGGFQGGVQVLYRSCEHRKDYSGGQNNFVSMADLSASEAKQSSFVTHCARLMEAAKSAAQVPA